MSVIRLRRLQHDEAELRDWLAGAGAGAARLLEAHGTPPERYAVALNVPGVARLDTGSKLQAEERIVGPFVVRDQHVVHVWLQSDYPLRPPPVAFAEGLFHPNIYSNGRLCWGNADTPGWWRGGEGLGMLFERLVLLTQGSPECTNPDSPANLAAVAPYRSHAPCFPLKAPPSRGTKPSSPPPAPPSAPAPKGPRFRPADPKADL